MAKTKQTARMSIGGRAPRKQPPEDIIKKLEHNIHRNPLLEYLYNTKLLKDNGEIIPNRIPMDQVQTFFPEDCWLPNYEEAFSVASKAATPEQMKEYEEKVIENVKEMEMFKPFLDQVDAIKIPLNRRFNNRKLVKDSRLEAKNMILYRNYANVEHLKKYYPEHQEFITSMAVIAQPYIDKVNEATKELAVVERNMQGVIFQKFLKRYRDPKEPMNLYEPPQKKQKIDDTSSSEEDLEFE